jgi:hypothetical protein
MATTSNYGWTTPDDTALVKDGASAIRSLGTAIDTSLNTALGTKKAGMVLLNTTSFSAVASQYFTGVFSSTYQNYRIVGQWTAAPSVVKLRMSNAGSAITTSTYRRGGWYNFTGSSSGYYYPSASETSVVLSDTATAYSVIDIFRPFEANPTGIVFQTYGDTGAAGMAIAGFGANTNSTSYDGFQLSPDSGTTTGTVRIYGYNN